MDMCLQRSCDSLRSVGQVLEDCARIWCAVHTGRSSRLLCDYALHVNGRERCCGRGAVMFTLDNATFLEKLKLACYRRHVHNSKHDSRQNI